MGRRIALGQTYKRVTIDRLWRTIEQEVSSVGIVGIDGGGGAGKSTLARQLQRSAEGVQVVEMDDFYRPEPANSERSDEPCWFFDWRRLRDEVFRPLATGETARFRPHDWENGGLCDETIRVEPGGVVIVEGISTLRRELREWVDFGVWVEAPKALRLERGLERDGASARQTWERYWMPEEERYFEAHQPRRYADIEVQGL
jgi:uridine kinase